jgi:hypothetical protein
MATPLAFAPPPPIPVRLDPFQGCGKTIEGKTTDLAQLAGKEKIEQKVEEAAAKKIQGSDPRG